ncbi:MAG: hypothetical protein QM808_16815 [Steroidobacteraceae bacterium]
MLKSVRVVRHAPWLVLALASASNVCVAEEAPAKSSGKTAAVSAALKGGATGKGYTWADVAKWPNFEGNWTNGGLMGTPGPAAGMGGGGAVQGGGGPPAGGAGGAPGGGMGAGGPGGGPGANTPLTDAFRAAYQAAQKGKPQGIGNCEPMGVISDSGGSFYFNKDVIVIGGLSDWYNVWRRVYMDGRGHPEDVEPSYFGHSTGQWQGDTLVIDTVAIRGEAQIQQGMHVDNTETHVVERLRLIDKDTLEMKRTITNPEVFSKPWEVTKTMKRTDEEYFESYCWTDRDEVLGGNLDL